jgi:DNA modification methylase
MNRLYYGDNLGVLTGLPAQSVDLIYLDPPFNSDRSYNVIFGRSGQRYDDDAAAQIHAFDDTWHWTPSTAHQLYQAADRMPAQVGEALMAFSVLLGENDAMAYLVNMTPRLVQMHRVLKPNGSLYLHCDPTMSHYLKILLDTIFGPDHFQNEIIWKRSGAHSGSKRYSPVHDVILFFAKGSRHTWNKVLQPLPQETIDQWYNNVEPGTGRRYNRQVLTGPGSRSGQSGQPWRGIDPGAKGRHWAIPGFVGALVAGLSTHDALDALDAAGRLHWPAKAGGIPMLKWYLDEAKGVPALDVITDIPRLPSTAAERLGYPTQKPVALLERIIRASSDPGDTVLDPFCGCGTTIDAAQRLDRRWIGIDIAFIAINIIEKRLHDRFPGIAGNYEVDGTPEDMAGARKLFSTSAFEFQRWAVSQISNARPTEKQAGDKGVDGIAFFSTGQKIRGRVIISVKGGKRPGPEAVRDLIGTVETQKAQMGILITMAEPSPGVRDAVEHGGTYVWPINGKVFPRVQVITIRQLLDKKRPEMPLLDLVYSKATKAVADTYQPSFGDLPAEST